METIEEIIIKLKEILKDKVIFASIFGSSITPYFSDESDIDIGIYLENFPIDTKDLWEFRYQITREFNRNIDVIFLNASDIIITMQVLMNGKLIINSQPGFYHIFKSRKISEYLDFKEKRQFIENQLINRKIYA